ncbi:phosphoenolpyruvate--protein phosphotransferase [Bradyrhizobium erythrophlei]|uniref:Phosphoenolpyruvate-protein phosphotransferase n=1 Tax=Bradyrhizobium erythrophlei TaxID=1437360 RepID=A0A1M7T4J6_9BRAD|nr:phosphoenolpyruvate--protein phosphotransferase [Bradyrhizobium erythrophlei]SHN65611.1 phosphoenolpyruvate--protein phosphotransferase [Bradyrhizobium erythrophlei]
MDHRTSRAPHRIEGRPAAPGIAVGPLLRLVTAKSVARKSRSKASEQQALVDAIETSRLDLTVLAGKLKDEDAEAILAFQIALLDDENLAAPAFALIAGGEAANRAWLAAIDPEIATYDQADDPYFRARASDLRDLRDRVLRRLAGEVDQAVPSGVIVAAEDMPPSVFLATEWRDGGLVLRRGSPSSHVAILARSRGVPMIVGVDIDHLESGVDAVLDGDKGALIINPNAALRANYHRRLVEQAAARQSGSAFSGPVSTASGEQVQLMINVTGLAELKQMNPSQVDGIGLMRTEFLFQEREALPTEEEQYQVYRQMAEWAAGKPVTIRTLDAGGDKPIAGLTEAGDLNPFLGVRGVRLSLKRLDVFRVQLRALARAAVTGNLKVMIPMVTVPEELDRCRDLFRSVVGELNDQGGAAAMPPIGMMVEVPAAAIAVEDFNADFYSIGSNDLIQYVMATSRDEPQLADLARPSRAVFQLIAHVVDHARRRGREASLCGDLAGDPQQVASLLDQGLRSFSVAPGALGPVRGAISRYSGKA